MGENRKRKILIIDDDQSVYDQISQPLLAKGFEIFSVTEPQEAVEKAKEIKPDLIFCSLLLKASNGLKISRAIHTVEALHNIPLIMLISAPGELDPQYTKTIGILDVLLKPPQPSEVISKTMTILGEGHEPPVITPEAREEPAEEELEALPIEEEPAGEEVLEAEMVGESAEPLEALDADVFALGDEDETPEGLPDIRAESFGDMEEPGIPEMLEDETLVTPGEDASPEEAFEQPGEAEERTADQSLFDADDKDEEEALDLSQEFEKGAFDETASDAGQSSFEDIFHISDEKEGLDEDETSLGDFADEEIDTLPVLEEHAETTIDEPAQEEMTGVETEEISVPDSEQPDVEQREEEPDEITQMLSEETRQQTGDEVSETEKYETYAELHRDPMKKVFVVIISLFIVAGLGFIGFQVKKFIFPGPPEPPAPSVTEVAPGEKKPSEKEVITEKFPGVDKTDKKVVPLKSTETPVTVAKKPSAPKETTAIKKKAYSVQIGAFSSETNARSLAEKFKKKGYDAFVHTVTRAGQKPIHKVLVGTFDDRAKAQEYSRLLLKKEGVKSILFLGSI